MPSKHPHSIPSASSSPMTSSSAHPSLIAPTKAATPSSVIPTAVSRVFEDFTYEREIKDAGGRSRPDLQRPRRRPGHPGLRLPALQRRRPHRPVHRDAAATQSCAGLRRTHARGVRPGHDRGQRRCRSRPMQRDAMTFSLDLSETQRDLQGGYTASLNKSCGPQPLNGTNGKKRHGQSFRKQPRLGSTVGSPSARSGAIRPDCRCPFLPKSCSGEMPEWRWSCSDPISPWGAIVSAGTPNRSWNGPRNATAMPAIRKWLRSASPNPTPALMSQPAFPRPL